MESHIYPWGGEFTTGDPSAPVAVVTLAKDLKLPADKVAIHGKMKTENLGIEKVVANVISNPNIRFVVVFGDEIRGHRAGGSLLALHRNGLDGNRRVIDAPGAVPYIENIDDEAVRRFREQVEIIDHLGITDRSILMDTLDTCHFRNPGSFGDPFIAIRIQEERQTSIGLTDMLALHNTLSISPFLEISNMGDHDTGLHLHSSLSTDQYGRVRTA